MNCTVEQVVGVVADYLSKARGVPKASIGAKTGLFQEGLVDSFALVELTAALEDRLGVKLPEGALMPDDFESPEVLHARLSEV